MRKSGEGKLHNAINASSSSTPSVDLNRISEMECAASDKPRAEANPYDEPNRSVKLDAFHLTQRLVEEVRGGPSKPLARLFAVMLSMAIFEDNPEDCNQIRETARDGGAPLDIAKRLPRSAYKRRIRRRIPVPSVLKQRIVAVYEAFRHIQREDGQPFFKSGIAEKISSALKHVENGCVSDTPGIPLYCGTPGQTLNCGRGSSSLEAFHRHLRTAFPGFSYGAELFDSVLSEYIFRTNARAASRSNLERTPRSVSEVVAFERLYALCSACSVQIQDTVSNGLTPLPPNNGEIFGLEDIGDWARKVENSLKLTDDVNFEEGGESDSVCQKNSGDEDDECGELQTVQQITDTDEYITQLAHGKLSTVRFQNLLNNLRGTGATSQAFLRVVSGGNNIRKPTTSEEMDLLRQAMKEEGFQRSQYASKSKQPMRHRNIAAVTDIYNQLVFKKNREHECRQDDLLLACSTKKQIECAINAVEEVDKVRSERTSFVTFAAGSALQKLQSQNSNALSTWPLAMDHLSTVLRFSTGNQNTEEVVDPGTFDGALLSPQGRKKAGNSSVVAVASRIGPQNNASSVKNSEKAGQRKRPTCRSCRIVLGESVPLSNHPRRCSNKTKADELRARKEKT